MKIIYENYYVILQYIRNMTAIYVQYDCNISATYLTHVSTNSCMVTIFLSLDSSVRNTI